MSRGKRHSSKKEMNRLAQLSLVVGTLALVVSIVSLIMAWHIYSTGTRPQTEFQRIDIELQRIKERLDQQVQRIDGLRTEGVDVSQQENILEQANASYLDAWNTWLQHDYTQAERLARNAANQLDLLPQEGGYSYGPPLWLFLISTLSAVILILAAMVRFFVKRRRVATKEEEQPPS